MQCAWGGLVWVGQEAFVMRMRAVMRYADQYYIAACLPNASLLPRGCRQVIGNQALPGSGYTMYDLILAIAGGVQPSSLDSC